MVLEPNRCVFKYRIAELEAGYLSQFMCKMGIISATHYRVW